MGAALVSVFKKENDRPLTVSWGALVYESNYALRRWIFRFIQSKWEAAYEMLTMSV